MNILIVSQYFYPENFRINDFASSLVGKGHSVTVLTGLPNYPKGKLFGSFKFIGSEDINNMRVYRVPLIPRGNSGKVMLSLNYISFLISSILFSPFFFARKDIDVVFSINYSPATVGITGKFIAKFKQAKNCLWVQDLWPDSLVATESVKSDRILSLIDKIMGWIYRNNDFIFVQSESFSKRIKLYGVKEKSLIFLPNWAEDIFIEGMEDTLCEAANKLDNKKFTLMFAGNLGEAQSLETILKAMKILENEDLQVCILGDGRKRQWMEDNIRDLNLYSKIKMLGSHPLNDMPAFFKKADFMLVTLKRDDIFANTIPGKVQSYLLSGKPIISALDGEGAKVIESSDSGFNCPSEDYEALAQNIKKAMNLSEARKKEMGENGREYYYKNFDKDYLINKFIKTVKLK